MQIRLVLGLAAAVAVVLGAAASASANDPQGPPPYVSFPHLKQIKDTPAYERGQWVAIPGGIGPAQFAADQTPMQAGEYEQGVAAPTNIVTGTTSSTNALDSYQGESFLVSGNGLLVGGQNDIYPSNCNAAAARGAFGDCAVTATVSADGGQTWMRTKLFRDWSGVSYQIGFDPGVAFDGNTFFYSYGVSGSGNNAPNGIVVASSSDGANWEKKTPVVLYTSNTSIFEDKYFIAADQGTRAFGSKSLYVAWDRNQGNNQLLLVSRSRDGAGSWSTPVKIDDGRSKFERVIGAYPAVDQRDGTVYVAWHAYANNKIQIDKSTDGGVTWGKDVTAATTNTGFGMDIGCNGGRRMSPAFHLLAGPNGELYVVYANNVAGNGYDILLTKSTNGGQTWSTPRRVNDDAQGTGRHQYNPGASINPITGEVTVSWLDRRADAGNCLTETYATRTSDGVSFTPNELVTNDGKGASNFDGNPNGPGDYAGGASIASGASESYAYYARHVDAGSETGTAGGFEVYSSKITP